MGSELLTEDLDNINEGDSEEAESPLLISRMFDECFPYYLSLGMTAEQYWDGDPELVKAYRKAEDIRTHRRNTEMWIEGRYIYDAMCCLIPSHNMWKPKQPLDYLREPYPLTKKEVEDMKLREMKRKQDELREKIKANMLALKNKKKVEEKADV